MTKSEKITVYNSLEEGLHYDMLRESSGDYIDAVLFRAKESNERLVMLLAFEGVKAKIQSGFVFLA